MFIWKLLHNCLPAFDKLKERGIPVARTCVMCNDLEESTVHLFLECNYARAIWHGSNPGLRTSDMEYISVDQWLELSSFGYILLSVSLKSSLLSLVCVKILLF